jgi:alcohol dehydrogenase
MRVRAAVLRASAAPSPYVESLPIDVCDVDLDEPGAGQILVKVMAASICHSDLSVVNGSRPRPLPMVLGHEASGVVVAVGRDSARGATPTSVGDHVVLVFVSRCGQCRYCLDGRPSLCEAAAASNSAGTLKGGARRLSESGSDLNHHLGVSAFSEYAVVDSTSAVVIDDDVPFDVAAMFGCALLTGVGAVVNAAGVTPNDTVAVWGMGGVGLSAVMGARAVGAQRVIAIDPAREKRELAMAVGADAAIDSADDLRSVLPSGADAAIEAVGHPQALLAAYQGTARGGRTVTVGLPSPDATLTIPAVSLVTESRTLIGSYLGSADPAVMIPELLDWWRQGRLPVEKLISRSLSLDDVNAGMDALATGLVARQVLRPHQAPE